MPICLNLLAEAQAAEDLRRRDPVKRAVFLAGLLVALMLVWSSWLQVNSMIARGELSRVESQMASSTNKYTEVVVDQRKIGDIKQKLIALNRLTTNRFLCGPLLNVLQQTTLDNVRLLKLRTSAAYSSTVESKPVQSGSNLIPGKPATATEKIMIILDGKDSAATPGDQVNRFKDVVATNPFFQTLLGKTNEVRLTSLSTPQSDPGGQPFVLFTLECRLPEKTR
jgi:hypothetical protein